MGVRYHMPTTGPKAYTARGSSGWMETFVRSHADQQLQSILGEKPIAIAIEGYRNRLRLTQDTPDWSSILGYLADIACIDSMLIPDEAAVAFWCQIILAGEEIKN